MRNMLFMKVKILKMQEMYIINNYTFLHLFILSIPIVIR